MVNWPNPRQLPPTEGERNAKHFMERVEFKKNHSQHERIKDERDANRIRAFNVERANLGLGSSTIRPYMEVTLPYDSYASSLLMKLRGCQEGEAVALLSSGDPRNRSKLGDIERMFVQKRTPMAEDFTIPKGRIVRFLTQSTRVLTL